VEKGGRRFWEDESLLKYVQSVSSFGPAGLKRLYLFRGTPLCSRQIPILLPTAISDYGFPYVRSSVTRRPYFVHTG
jgi:hypothetical protein